MLILKRAGQALMVASLCCFTWIGWFLFTTPPEAFDTQGPGIFGALVLFFAQVCGVLGVALFGAWWLVNWERRLKAAASPPLPNRQKPRRITRAGIFRGLAASAFALLITAAIALIFADRFLNFDCPPGTVDYCAWTPVFVIETFGPGFLLLAVICVIGLNKLNADPIR